MGQRGPGHNTGGLWEFSSSLSLAINVQMCALQPRDLRWEVWELANLTRYHVMGAGIEIREEYT